MMNVPELIFKCAANEGVDRQMNQLVLVLQAHLELGNRRRAVVVGASDRGSADERRTRGRSNRAGDAGAPRCRAVQIRTTTAGEDIKIRVAKLTSSRQRVGDPRSFEFRSGCQRKIDEIAGRKDTKRAEPSVR